MKRKIRIACVALPILAAAGVALAADPTAFALVKAGNQYIGGQSKDKVVQIRSERSAATLVPNIWYVVYYDPDATLKAVEVKFGAGQKMDVSRPLRLLEPVTGADKVLDPAKLKVDSDQALAIHNSGCSTVTKGRDGRLNYGRPGPTIPPTTPTWETFIFQRLTVRF